MAKTLLQKAKDHKSNKQSSFKPTKEMEDVALAWCRNEITHTQICKAMSLDNTGYRVYSILALSLKHYLSDKI